MTSGKGVDDFINTLIKNYGQDIVMAFSPPLVGCLVKKGLQKGGHGHTGYAYESVRFHSCLMISLDRSNGEVSE